jgi:hypothetical protein
VRSSLHAELAQQLPDVAEATRKHTEQRLQRQKQALGAQAASRAGFEATMFKAVSRTAANNLRVKEGGELSHASTVHIGADADAWLRQNVRQQVIQSHLTKSASHQVVESPRLDEEVLEAPRVPAEPSYYEKKKFANFGLRQNSRSANPRNSRHEL